MVKNCSRGHICDVFVQVVREMDLVSKSNPTTCCRVGCSQLPEVVEQCVSCSVPTQLPAASYLAGQANQELCRRQRETLPEAASCALKTKQTKNSSKQQLFQNLNVSPTALVFNLTFQEEFFMQESSVVPLLKASYIQPYNKLQGWIF